MALENVEKILNKLTIPRNGVIKCPHCGGTITTGTYSHKYRLYYVTWAGVTGDETYYCFVKGLNAIRAKAIGFRALRDATKAREGKACPWNDIRSYVVKTGNIEWKEYVNMAQDDSRVIRLKDQSGNTELRNAIAQYEAMRKEQLKNGSKKL
jgi:hypothetical protein